MAVPLVIVIFLAIGLHEYAHCKFADMAGDPTPGIYGRVTLDLTKHFELFGTLMMLLTAATGFGIGWGKPAPMNPSKMRNPRWDFFAAVAAGPISNVLQAVFWALLGRVLLVGGIIQADALLMFADGLGGEPFRGDAIIAGLIFYGVFVNLSLAIFNLIPLGPLDGHWLVGLLMPERTRDKWFWLNKRYGWYLLLAIVLIGQVFPQYSLLAMIRRPIMNLGIDLFLQPFFPKP
ncbi:MAG: site-2 protease family protein [Fimbriimonas sp.]